MIIELQRAHTPEEIGQEEECPICGDWFTTEVVLAFTKTNHRDERGLACQRCVEVMGGYKPEKFPTIEAYRAALGSWRGPIWGSIEEASASWESGEPWHAILEANTIRQG